MIEGVSPLLLFAFYTISAASTAVSLRCLNEEMPLTPRTIIGTAVFHGLIGGGLGMQVYEWKRLIWASFMTSVGYGGGIVKIAQAKIILKEMLK